MQQLPIRSHTAEDLLDIVKSINIKGTKILANMEQHIATLGQTLSQEDIAELGLDTRSVNRRLSIQEVCTYLDISRSSFNRYVADGKFPERPVRKTASGATVKTGYSIDDLANMRASINKVPRSEIKAFIGFLNQKGGVGKSTLTWMFSQWLALLGYRILIVDTDPQASISFLYGYKARIDTGYADTYAPFVLQDDGMILVTNSEGEEELIPDPEQPEAQAESIEEFGENGLHSLHYAIHTTHWPNIDIIPANNEILEIDVNAAAIDIATRKFSLKTGIPVRSSIEFLRAGLETVADDYDVILFDGTPSVNVSTMNIISSCDSVVIPTPCSMLDYASTVEFYSLLETILMTYLEAPKNGGRDYRDTPVPKLHALLTKFDRNSEPSKFMEKLISKTFSGHILSSYALQFTEIQKQASSFKSIYEVNLNDTNNPKALKESRASFDAVFSEILTTIINPLHEGRMS